MTAAEQLADLRRRLEEKVAEWRKLANNPTPVMVVGEINVLESVADEIEEVLVTVSLSVAEPVFAYGEREERVCDHCGKAFGSVYDRVGHSDGVGDLKYYHKACFEVSGLEK